MVFIKCARINVLFFNNLLGSVVVEIICLFIAGLALFLMSFQLIVKYMQRLMGDRVRKVVQSAGNNRLKATCMGLGSTMLFQNSTAVLVLVIGFVEMGALSLLNSVPLVLGVNIGAACSLITILLSSFNVSICVSLVSIVGAFMVALSKHEKVKNVGYLLFAIGILFLGMFLMSDSMAFLRTLPEVSALLTSFTSPILLVLVGLAVGTIVQSSLASNAILITLCAVGASAGLDIVSALWLSFSFKVGPTLMGLIASFGSKKASKAVALLHFCLNVLILLVFALSTLTGWHVLLANAIDNAAVVIVLANIIVCAFTCLCLLPFSKYVAAFLGKIGKDKENKFSQFEMEDNAFAFSGVAIEMFSHQAMSLQKNLVNRVNDLIDCFFTNEPKKTIKELNGEIKDFSFMYNMFNSNLGKLSVELNAQEYNKMRYFYNLVSRYSSMVHRYEKILIILKDTKGGSSLTKKQQNEAMLLFSKIKDLALMSESVLKAYLSQDDNHCIYLNNVIKVDDDINQTKLEIKKDLICLCRENKDIKYTEVYARLINETEQLGEHFTAIALNIL